MSLTCLLTLGLTGCGSKGPAPPTQQQTMQNMALQVKAQLNSQGYDAPDDKIQAAVGYELNTYNAWQEVYTNTTIVNQIIQATILALINSGLVVGAAGTVNANVAVLPTGQLAPAAATAAQVATGSPIIVSPAMVAVGGAGFLALLLLMGGKKHVRPRR
jgi:hypothetical protein